MSPICYIPRNGLELAVFDSVLYRAARYPSVAAKDEFLADVANIAFNYLRNRGSGGKEAPIPDGKAIDCAVLASFDRVYAQHAPREWINNLHAAEEQADSI